MHKLSKKITQYNETIESYETCGCNGFTCNYWCGVNCSDEWDYLSDQSNGYTQTHVLNWVK